MFTDTPTTWVGDLIRLAKSKESKRIEDLNPPRDKTIFRNKTPSLKGEKYRKNTGYLSGEPCYRPLQSGVYDSVFLSVVISRLEVVP